MPHRRKIAPFPIKGTQSVSVTINDVDGSSATANSTAQVADKDALTITGYGLSGTEGQPVNGVVATFTDSSYPANSPSDFTANINWGDGTSSAGTVTPQGSLFVVSGNHTYAEKGVYSITVAIQDDGSGVASATTISTIVIADAPLTATGKPVTGTEGLGISSGDEIATFTDGNPNASASDFFANIDWGNGTSEHGIISSLGNGMFQVTVPLGIIGGTITSPSYPEDGHYTVTTTITDVDGS